MSAPQSFPRLVQSSRLSLGTVEVRLTSFGMDQAKYGFDKTLIQKIKSEISIPTGDFLPDMFSPPRIWFLTK